MAVIDLRMEQLRCRRERRRFFVFEGGKEGNILAVTLGWKQQVLSSSSTVKVYDSTNLLTLPFVSTCSIFFSLKFI